VTQAHHQRGLQRLGEGALLDALAQFDLVLAQAPQDGVCLYHRGLALHGLGRLAAAAEAYARAALYLADPVPALVNRGNALQALGLEAQALAVFDAAVAWAPDHAALRYNRGVALQATMRLEAACADYERALAVDPHHAAARWNLSLCLLARGDLATGFAGYETGIAACMRVVQSFPQPRWDGTPLAGRHVLLHAEAGLGDTLQFCRYARRLAAQGQVSLVVQPPLVRLLQSLDVPVFARGDALPDFDVQAPLMSLPYLCGTVITTIPDEIPYLRPDSAAVARWDAVLGDGLRVGLVWAGAARPELPEAHAVDQRRSMPLREMAGLGHVAGLRLVSLQKGPAGQQTPPFDLLDPTGLLGDFADTAALVAALDLVISVDTSTAHLAGALGKPVWLLNRFDSCWRWMTDRADSPWYPSMRIFRQPYPGDWASVMAEVVAALRARPRFRPLGGAAFGHHDLCLRS
jgi:hypothetical protein